MSSCGAPASVTETPVGLSLMPLLFADMRTSIGLAANCRSEGNSSTCTCAEITPIESDDSAPGLLSESATLCEPLISLRSRGCVSTERSCSSSERGPLTVTVLGVSSTPVRLSPFASCPRRGTSILISRSSMASKTSSSSGGSILTTSTKCGNDISELSSGAT